MPALLPTRDALVTSPSNIADMLLLAASGQMRGTLLLSGFTFAQADQSVVFTVPAGYRTQIEDAFWEPLTSLTGGAASAIGLKSSNAGYNTAGDILGGAGGDVAAGLTAVAATPLKRTVGAKIAAGVILIAGDTIIYNKMVSAFTAGTFNIALRYSLIPSV